MEYIRNNKFYILLLIPVFLISIFLISLISKQRPKIISIINPGNNFATNKNSIDIRIAFSTNPKNKEGRGGGNIKVIKLTVNSKIVLVKKNPPGNKKGEVTFTLDISKFSNQKIALQVIASQGKDISKEKAKAKLSYESEIVYILIDRTAPIITKYTPKNNLKINNLRLIFSAEFSDNFSGIDKSKTRVFVDKKVIVKSGASPLLYEPETDWSEGRHFWYLLIADRAGNSTKLPLKYFDIDHTAPVISKLIPKNNLKTNNLLLNLSAEFTDDFSGINNNITRFFVDNKLVIRNRKSPLIYEPSIDWSEGRHSWYLVIEDLAGNSTKSPIKYFNVDLSGGAVKTIKAIKGGLVKIPGKVSINIPPNALKVDTSISIKVDKHQVNPAEGTKDSGGISLPNTTYVFGPHGTTFKDAVTISVNYDPSPLNQLKNMLGENAPNEADLKVLQYDHHSKKNVPVGGKVNLMNKTVTASINHFSHYSVGLTWAGWWKSAVTHVPGYCSFPIFKLTIGFLKYGSIVFHDDCTRHDLCYKYGYATYKKCSQKCSSDFCDDIYRRCDRKSSWGWLYLDKEACYYSAFEMCNWLMAFEKFMLIGPDGTLSDFTNGVFGSMGGVSPYHEQCCADYDHSRYRRPPTEKVNKKMCQNNQSDASEWCAVMKDPAKKNFFKKGGHKTKGWSDSGWDGTVKVTCKKPYTKRIKCSFVADGNTGKKNPIGATSGDRASTKETSSSCIMKLHHDGKSFGGSGHWIYGYVTATCEVTNPGDIPPETVNCPNR